jgi:large subunit ribosomal protein L3
MADNNRIHKGSLQFYPRVRAKKVIPRINWRSVPADGRSGLLGFIGYKVGMVSVYVKDNTPDSMTKGKRIVIPATVIECPTMKIYSVRYYKNKKVLKDFVVSNDKVLKKTVKYSKNVKELKDVEGFDDVRVILYSNVANTGTGKKRPDMVEVALAGSNEEKLAWIKENLNKEISVKSAFEKGLLDVHAVTKGYGNQGPMKRFGVALKDHKSERGRRRPGSLSSFGLRRVTFRAPQAGQTGYQCRVDYNNLILDVADIKEKDINPKGGFNSYGVIKNDYIIVQGSVIGSKKRGIFMTAPARSSKYQSKKEYEVIEVR